MIETSVDSAGDMLKLGAQYARSAKSGDVFGLIGTLGTGKTHWTKGFVQAMNPDTLVSSPTFSIINEYTEGACKVFHFDFYRLNTEQELLSIGWEEYLDESGIIICEWADLFLNLMPENTIWLELSHQSECSRIVRQVSKPVEA
ncbi:MAG: tRNA (adenosine(37)-N6)-threonylcarbamoyltransferase complex ATPase subunit type 1 TsaE [Armatimonadetes bacterium]|nr:tRNA (adenosine(37)-N6)-threonylcarbamoyltransferase complex ATPase subunit type 1 TsaE [Akkermansiaceae bacterium]